MSPDGWWVMAIVSGNSAEGLFIMWCVVHSSMQGYLWSAGTKVDWLNLTRILGWVVLTKIYNNSTLILLQITSQLSSLYCLTMLYLWTQYCFTSSLKASLRSAHVPVCVCFKVIRTVNFTFCPLACLFTLSSDLLVQAHQLTGLSSGVQWANAIDFNEQAWHWRYMHCCLSVEQLICFRQSSTSVVVSSPSLCSVLNLSFRFSHFLHAQVSRSSSLTTQNG